MKKRVYFVIFLFILLFSINYNVNAAFPSSLENLSNLPYCSGAVCYCGPYNDYNTFKTAAYQPGTLNPQKTTANSKYLIGTSNVLNVSTTADVIALACTNHTVSGPASNGVSTCTKITSSATAGY